MKINLYNIYSLNIDAKKKRQKINKANTSIKNILFREFGRIPNISGTTGGLHTCTHLHASLCYYLHLHPHYPYHIFGIQNNELFLFNDPTKNLLK